MSNSHKKTIIIEPFLLSDTQEIVTLFRDAVHVIAIQHYSPEQVAVWAPENVDIDRWRQKLEKNITYVAKVDGIIVGIDDISHEGYLDHLYINTEYRGGRVAYALFKKIEEKARELGLAKITTDCSITAKKPAEFMGFVTIKEQTVVRDGVALTNYAMEKIL